MQFHQIIIGNIISVPPFVLAVQFQRYFSASLGVKIAVTYAWNLHSYNLYLVWPLTESHNISNLEFLNILSPSPIRNALYVSLNSKAFFMKDALYNAIRSVLLCNWSCIRTSIIQLCSSIKCLLKIPSVLYSFRQVHVYFLVNGSCISCIKAEFWSNSVASSLICRGFLSER